ncbi:MAG: hypothetical protein PHT94_00615 [Candidatus Nanoarchaeia archaeon]|nr:hypothetical protein [Candidatus Nanoarchaeia archaeon]
MGYYVNPNNIIKEEWLSLNAEKVSKEIAVEEVRKDKKAVLVLIDNGLFTACGLAFNEREFNDFTDEEDRRPKTFYITEHHKLKDVIAGYESIDWELVKKM